MRLADLAPLEIDIDEAEDRVAIFTIGTPAGPLTVVAEVTQAGRTLRLRSAHVEGPGRNAIGLANLRVLAELVMETLDYDAIDIQGASRTTGAWPNKEGPSQDHRPRFRLARRRAPDLPGPGQGSGGDSEP